MSRGRKQKYGEPTVVFRHRVPESKNAVITKLVKDELKKYETGKSDGETEEPESENTGED